MTNQPHQFLITAIMCDPSSALPIGDGDYFSVAYLHSSDDLSYHNAALVAQGFRVTSVKCTPADQAGEELLNDLQGNQPVVDGKPIDTGVDE